MTDETFCIYCQKEYGTFNKLKAHLRRMHPGTYAAHSLFGPDEVSDAIAGLRSLGGSLPDEVDAAICRRAAEVIDHLRRRLDLSQGIGLRVVKLPDPDEDTA